jgi:protein involved in temperature-dependent protein secretion
MPVEPEKKLSDEELDQLARELFAEVRGEASEAQAERALQSAADVAGEVVPILPDWLLDAGDDNAGGDSDG